MIDKYIKLFIHAENFNELRLAISETTEETTTISETTKAEGNKIFDKESNF